MSSPCAHLSSYGSFAENNSVTDVAVEVVQGAGPTRLMRFLEMSRDLFCSTLNSLIIAGRFNHIEHAHVRLEGQTAWGVWLHVDHWRGAHCSRLCLRCGVLHHVANRELTFHGSDVDATQLLLPIFADWTYPTSCHQQDQFHHHFLDNPRAPLSHVQPAPPSQPPDST